MSNIKLDLGLGDNPDWRNIARNRLSKISKHPDQSKQDTIRRLKDNGLVTIQGVEYWFEPDREACAQALNLPRHQIGSFGVKNSIVNFYDYHQSAGTPDVKKRFLDKFTIVSTDTTTDGPRKISWKNCCCQSYGTVEDALYDYLATYTWPQKCSEIVDFIRFYIKNTNLSPLELHLNDVIIGERFFNDLFYQSALMVAETILTPQLIDSMLVCIQSTPVLLSPSSPIQYALISQLDEAERHVFRTDLDDGKFEEEEFLRDVRYWRCSQHDLQTRILPLILFISNWSLVLGAYLAVAEFGSSAFTVGE